jgi:RNA polymerase sigma-70 factor (ECF subfamily)
VYNTNQLNILVKALINNNKTALDELYNYYYPRLYTFAKRFLKVEDDINDILQDVFIKIWENRKNIKNVETFNAYIFTITKNTVISYFREKIKVADFESRVREMATTEGYLTETAAEYEDIKEKVDQLIEQLPEKRKQIFKLSREQGLSNKEIAGEMGISVKTVEDHIMHAIRFLKNNLKTLDIITLLYLALFL